MDESKFREICNKYNTLEEARIGYSIENELLNKRTFKKYTDSFGISFKGKASKRKIKLIDILNGGVPHYQTNKLRIRLIKEKVFEEKCNNCELYEWQGSKIPLQLDHIDGNNSNHKKYNLRLLCPNCHAQTPTFCGRNKKRKEVIEKIDVRKIEIEKITKIILESDIQFEKYGWVSKVSKIIGITSQKSGAWMKRNMPVFYEEKCYKRKKD